MFFCFIMKNTKCRISPLLSRLFPIVGMGVEIVLYDIHQCTEGQVFLLGIVLHMEHRVECAQEGFHIVPAVHFPPVAQQQGTDQFDKVSHCPVKEDDLFFYQVFFPNNMIEQA